MGRRKGGLESRVVLVGLFDFLVDGLGQLGDAGLELVDGLLEAFDVGLSVAVELVEEVREVLGLGEVVTGLG